MTRVSCDETEVGKGYRVTNKDCYVDASFEAVLTGKNYTPATDDVSNPQILDSIVFDNGVVVNIISDGVGLVEVPADSTSPDNLVNVSYTTLVPYQVPPGGVAYTIEATDDILVDVDVEGRVLGTEVIGDGNWVDGIIKLVMSGRLRAVKPSAGVASRQQDHT